MPEMDSGEYIIRDLEKKWNTIFNYKDVEFQGISILTTKRLIQVDKEESVITNQLALLDIANSEVGLDDYGGALIKMHLKSGTSASLLFYLSDPTSVFNPESEAIQNKVHYLAKQWSDSINELVLAPKVNLQVAISFDVDSNGVLSIKCPNCKAPKPVDSKSSEIRCPYCGTTYIVPQKMLDLIK